MKRHISTYITFICLMSPCVLAAQDEPVPEQAARPACVEKAVIIDEASNLNLQIHNLAEQLVKNYRYGMTPAEPVAVTTFVDVNHLYKTSPFGRYIAEQLIGELQRASFNVMEYRKTNSIMTREGFGEYSLSRDSKEIAKSTPAGLVLVGTYMIKDRYVMVNARIVDSNQLVHSSGMTIMRKDGLISDLLQHASVPDLAPPARIAIKGLGEPTPAAPQVTATEPAPALQEVKPSANNANTKPAIRTSKTRVTASSRTRHS
ncbi:MAG: FlgO family outer membrane protein [Dissulfuribacterales bacterium]